MGKTLSLHTGGNWAGYLPSFSDLAHECADDLNSYIYRSARRPPTTRCPACPPARSSPPPVPDQEPDADRLLGPQRAVQRHRLGVYNSDLAFKGNYVFAGHLRGLPHPRRPEPVRPDADRELHRLQHRPGRHRRLRQHPRPLVGLPGQRRARTLRAASSSATGFEGIHIFDISDPAEPDDEEAAAHGLAPATRPARRAAAARTPRPPSRTRPAATSTSTTAARAAPATASTSSGSSSRRHRREVPAARPHGRAGSSCHDNNVLLNVGGTTTSYAMCAGGNGLAMYKFDTTIAPTRRGGIEKPTLLWSKPDDGRQTGHSGSFTYDGKYLIFGHEPGGGTRRPAARRRARSSTHAVLPRPATGDTKGRCCTRGRRPTARTAPGTTSTSSRPRPATTRRSAPTSRASRSSTSRTRPRRARSPTPIRPRSRTRTGAAHHGHHPRRRLVDLLAQRLHLRVRHQARRDHVAAEPRRRRLGDAGQRAPQAHEHVRDVQPADADRRPTRLTPRARRSRSPRRRRARASSTARRSRRRSPAPTTLGVDSCVGTSPTARVATARSATRCSRSPRSTAPATSPPRKSPTWSTARTSRWSPRRHGRPDAGADAGATPANFGVFTPGIAREYLATARRGSPRRRATSR